MGWHDTCKRAFLMRVSPSVCRNSNLFYPLEGVTFMRISTVALLTLATLGAQSSNDRTNAAPNSTTSGIPETTEGSTKKDAVSISNPEIVGSKPFSSQDTLPFLQDSFRVESRETGNQPKPPDLLVLRNNNTTDTEYSINNTLAILGSLLFVVTIFPVVTISFFWLVRRLLVKEIVAEVDKRLKELDVLDSELKNASKISNNFKEKLDEQIQMAKQSIDFLNREAEISQASIQKIETLKSQFIAQLNSLLSEVNQAKSEVLQEFSQVKASLLNQMEVKEEIKEMKLYSVTSAKILPFPKPPEPLIADDYFKQGEALYLQGFYEDALTSIERALEINPNLDEAWYYKGNALVKLQQYDSAIEAYHQSIALKPDRNDVWYQRGNAFVRLKLYQDALNSYDQAIAIKPDDYNSWHNRAVMLWKLGRDDDALNSYDQAIAIKPDDYELWHNRGVLLGKLKRYQEAIESYQNAIKINPKKYEAWYNLGNMFGKLQRDDDAIHAYDQTLTIKQDKYEAWYNRGAIFAKLQKYQAALSSYNQAISLKSNDYELWHNRGVVLGILVWERGKSGKIRAL
jgi:tetratricopeptide (TPR) repeat protein